MTGDVEAHAVDSPVGRLVVAARSGALVRLGWSGSASAGAPSSLLREAAAQLEAYFDGRLSRFDLPLAPDGTAFRKRVWRAMSGIPYGGTATYGALARSLGTSARAVGGACGANPLPVIVPCHRVVAAGGLAGGYSGRGGLATKLALIALERGAGPWS